MDGSLTHCRFPRPCLVRSFLVNLTASINLASKLIPSESFPNSGAHGQVKPLTVVHLAVIETEHLLIEIAKQMVRLNGNVGSFQPALQERPKVFHRDRKSTRLNS